MSIEYCSLHQHSDASFLDACNKPDDLAQKAAEVGMKAIALTDHGSCHNFYKMHKACAANEIKFIPGIEFYFTYKHEEKERKSRHLTILCKNNEGLSSLYKLTTLANRPVQDGGGFFYRPRIDWENLEKHNKGLICLTGCMNSPVNHEFGRNEDYDAGKEHAKHLLGIFGKDRMFVELQMVNDPLDQPNRTIYIPEQDIIFEWSRKLASDLGLKAVATNDSHYLNKEDSFAHEVLKAIDAKATLNTPIADPDKGIRGRLVFNGFDYHVKSTEEMREKFSDEEIAMSETIADMCDVKFDSGEHMPMFESDITPDKAYDKLLKECREGWTFRNLSSKDNREEYVKRVKYELKDVKEAGLANYLLIVWDVLRFCRSENIPVGPGRGSAAGSLLCYLLRITQVDPVKHGLIWERFWNRGRKGSMPDIDIDVSIRKKDLVVEYVKEKFGRDRVFPIVTFGKMESKVALKDVGKVIGLPFSYMNNLTGQIPIVHNKPVKIKEAIEKSKFIEEASKGIDEDTKEWQKQIKLCGKDKEKDHIVTELRNKIAERKRMLTQTFEVAQKLESCNRQKGVHACALLIYNKPVFGEIPLCWDTKKKQFITAYDMYDLDELGCLKLDILGLKTLDVIADSHPEGTKVLYDPDSYFGEFDDKKTYKLIAKGYTKGVFQLESPLGRQWCKRMKPQNQEELSDLVALIRPAILEIGMADEYIKHKKSPDDIPYIHEDLIPILESTKGCQLYQEQMIRISEEFAGFNKSESDLLRKAVGKKIPEKLAKLKESFIAGVIKNKKNEKLAEELWRWIEKGAEYGFNKCVSGETVVYRSSANQYGKNDVTIAHLYKTKNDLNYAERMESIPLRKKLQKKKGYGDILALDGDGRIRPRPIKNIIFNGRKVTYNILFNDGEIIRATKDHKFFTKSGFVKVEDLKQGDYLVSDGGYEETDFNKANSFSSHSSDWKARPYSEPRKGFGLGIANPAYTNGSFTQFKESKLIVKDIDYCQRCLANHCKLEHNHIDGDRSNSSLENIEKLCSSCHKKADYEIGKRKKRWTKGHKTGRKEIVAIYKYGKEDTYDIEMDTAEHNYIANGVVSSNSHSMCYGGYLGYITAYMKAHYPEQFILSMLKFSKDEQDSQNEIMELFYEAKLFKINIRPPSIRRMNYNFELDGRNIYFGLGHIRDIGKSALSIIKSLKDKSWFEVMVDKKNLKINKKVVNALLMSGALDDLGITRKNMKDQFEFILELTAKEIDTFRLFIEGGKLEKTTKKDGTQIKLLKQQSDFESGLKEFLSFINNENKKMKLMNSRRAENLKNLCENFVLSYDKDEEYGAIQKAGYEEYYLSVPVTCNKIDMYKDRRATHNLLQTENEFTGVGVNAVCMINKINSRTDKNGRPMAFVGLQDQTFQMDGIMFCKAYNAFGSILEPGRVVLVEGKKIKGSLQIQRMEIL